MFDPPYPMVRDPAQRRRVFDQFARYVQLLDDDGFALLRTPWPFYDLVGAGEDDAGNPIGGKKIDVPLTIPGADGPETHTYNSMAMHWYMRRRDAD
jgi:hypothetical protein